MSELASLVNGLRVPVNGLANPVNGVRTEPPPAPEGAGVFRPEHAADAARLRSKQALENQVQAPEPPPPLWGVVFEGEADASGCRVGLRVENREEISVAERYAVHQVGARRGCVGDRAGQRRVAPVLTDPD